MIYRVAVSSLLWGDQSYLVDADSQMAALSLGSGRAVAEGIHDAVPIAASVARELAVDPSRSTPKDSDFAVIASLSCVVGGDALSDILRILFWGGPRRVNRKFTIKNVPPLRW